MDAGFRSAPRPRRASSLALAALAAWAVGACGGGSGGGGAAAQGLAAPAMSLTIGQPNRAYSASLAATGGAPPYAWSLVPGPDAPPAGVALDSAGNLSGIPTAEGTWGFAAAVTDSATPPNRASRAYSLQVVAFDVTIGGLEAGDAWTGESYSLDSPSADATVTYSLASNASGGAISSPDPAAHHASYLSGLAAGTDVIRATRPSGQTTDVPVRVRDSPVRNRIARFGSTDVWYVAFDRSIGQTAPTRSDFETALMAVGLRSPPTQLLANARASELASLYVRVRVLAHLSTYYLNADDGSPAPGGFAISFPWRSPPTPPYETPVLGGQDVSSPIRFSTIGVHSSVGLINSGLWGTSVQDDVANSHVECAITPDSLTPAYGVFVDTLAVHLNTILPNAVLPSAPVSASDEPALEALLYGLPNPGGRYDEMHRVADAFADLIAVVTAHEIGHALGLQHDAYPWSIMGAVSNWNSLVLTFSAPSRTQLQSALPGPGR